MSEELKWVGAAVETVSVHMSEDGVKKILVCNDSDWAELYCSQPTFTVEAYRTLVTLCDSKGLSIPQLHQVRHLFDEAVRRGYLNMEVADNG